MAAAERRDIMEVVGVAIGSSDLSSSETRERHVDMVAAVGAASGRLHYGNAGLPTVASAMRPTASGADQIAAELAPMLWHLKAGGQEQTALRVAGIFAGWMRCKPDFAAMHPQIVQAFAMRVVQEWCRTGCVRCRGAGVLEVDRRLGKVAPKSHARNARLVQCDLCFGSRRATPNHVDRAAWLGVTREVYDQEKWYRRFTVGLVWLDQIARRLRRPLQLESGRVKIRAQ